MQPQYVGVPQGQGGPMPMQGGPGAVVFVHQGQGGPVAWPAMPGAQSGCAKNADTLGTLATAPDGLYIQRQMQLLNLLFNFEQRTTLYAYNWRETPNPDDVNAATTADLSDTVLRMKEDSDCMVRFCIGSLRPFRMAVFPYSKATDYPPKHMDVFSLPNAVTIERPFRLPVFCLWRPLLRIRHNSMGCA
jgi:hypothetical protein